MFLLVLAMIAYRTALWSARWGPPVSYFAMLLLIGAALALWQAGRRIWRFVVHLGLRGMLLLIGIPLLGIYVIAGLSLGGGLGIQGWWAVARILVSRAATQVSAAAQSLNEIPGDLSIALRGRNLSGRSAEPAAISSVRAGIIVTPRAEPAPTREQLVAIEVGGTVQVVRTAGDALRAHSAPGTNTPISTRFVEGTMLEVIEGPVQLDGYTWWHVRNDQGSGWCVDRFLESIP
jgi:hypothetical protein